MKKWVDKLGSGMTASRGVAVPDRQRPESRAVQVARLEAENTALKAEARKLETERGILHQAAKYFAGETNW